MVLTWFSTPSLGPSKLCSQTPRQARIAESTTLGKRKYQTIKQAEAEAAGILITTLQKCKQNFLLNFGNVLLRWFRPLYERSIQVFHKTGRIWIRAPRKQILVTIILDFRKSQISKELLRRVRLLDPNENCLAASPGFGQQIFDQL